jgi:molybdopterin converting factor small subunit
MKITVTYYGGLKDAAGAPEQPLTFESDATPGRVIERVVEDLDGFSPEAMNSVAVAVNDELVERDYELADGDQVSLLPPISGG